MDKDLRPYTYQALEGDLQTLVLDFPDMEWGSIGKSLWGKELYYIKLGEGKNKILYNGAHHGMEWITAGVLSPVLPRRMGSATTDFLKYPSR